MNGNLHTWNWICLQAIWCVQCKGRKFWSGSCNDHVPQMSVVGSVKRFNVLQTLRFKFNWLRDTLPHSGDGQLTNRQLTKEQIGGTEILWKRQLGASFSDVSPATQWTIRCIEPRYNQNRDQSSSQSLMRQRLIWCYYPNWTFGHESYWIFWNDSSANLSNISCSERGWAALLKFIIQKSYFVRGHYLTMSPSLLAICSIYLKDKCA